MAFWLSIRLNQICLPDKFGPIVPVCRQAGNGYGMKTECFHPVANDDEQILDVYERIG
jgi:hypothetical protein